MSSRFGPALFPFLCALGVLFGVGMDSARGQVLEDVVRYSEQLPATGSPSVGMVGAGLYSGTASSNALFGNPAGLGWMPRSTIGGDFNVQRARSTAQFSTPDASDTANRLATDYGLLPLAGTYSFPTIQGSLVAGISFHQTNSFERAVDVTGANASSSITRTLLPSSFEVDDEDLVFDNTRSRIAYEAGAIDFSQTAFDDGNYPFFEAANPESPATDDQMVLDQRENIVDSGQMNELSMGAAVEVAPDIMLGGGLNVAFGSYTFERFYQETDASGLLPPEDPANPERPYDPYFLEGTDIEGFREFQLEERIDADIAGVNFRAGLSAQLLSSLRGGLFVESPTWSTVTEVFGTEMRTDFDCDFSLSGSPCPGGGIEGFESGSLTANEFEYKVRTPWRIAGGLQYTLRGLTVAGGVQLVDWRQALVSAEDASFSQLNRELRELDVTVNTQGGLEYTLNAVSVRAGVAYRPDPRPASFQNVDGGSTNHDRLFFSGGTSYTPAEDLTLHVSWLQERFDDQFQSYSEGPLLREALTRNHVLLGITFRL